MKIIKNPYYDRFRCIAQECPDSCCQQWDVQIDEVSAAKYRSLPGPLGDRLRQVLKDLDGETVMTIENSRCPMWRDDGLCQIQAELGEEELCKVCRDYPRLSHDYGDFIELGLELSCPEVARLLLTQPYQAPTIAEIPGGSQPEYDAQAMSVLLQTREKALSILNNDGYSHSQALTLLLMYAYHAQALLDELDVTVFSPNEALAQALNMASPADFAQLPAFFGGLEILTNTWRKCLQYPSPTAWSASLRKLAIYGVERYWLQAVSDYDLVCRVKMIVVSCLLVKALGGDPVSTAQLYSKEIENNIDNVEAILDAAYTHPAFTDNKLLWLINQP